jgi:hypothetical protein
LFHEEKEEEVEEEVVGVVVRRMQVFLCFQDDEEVGMQVF